MIKKLLLIFIIICIITCICLIPTYSVWISHDIAFNNLSIQTTIPLWSFGNDSDFSVIDKVYSSSNFVATQETAIVNNSVEAIKLTNTVGTQTKDHIVNINFDRDYELSEIRFYKLEFDYYHMYKREQNTRGFPKVQFTYNNSGLGNDQGGTDTINEKSPFVATNLDSDWWHLEYFVFAHIPTMADHQDSPIALTKKVNGIKINDRGIYDYASTTAFVVIDNLKFSSEPAARLGLFNRTSSFAMGTYFWFKVAWSGELHSCILTTSDPTIAVWDSASTKSPFYVEGLNAGTVTVTATLELGNNHQIFTISNTITVT